MGNESSGRLEQLLEMRRKIDAELTALLVSGNGAFDELRALSQHRDLLDEAIRQSSPAKPRISRAIVLNALIVATIVAAAATIPMCSVRFQVQTKSSTIVLDSSADQLLSGFPDSTEFRLNDGCGEMSTSLDDLADHARSDGRLLRMTAASLIVRRVNISAGSRITFTPQNSAIYVAIEKSREPIAVEIEVSGAVTATGAIRETPWVSEVDGTEWITLSSAEAPDSTSSHFCSFTLVPAETAHATFTGLQLSAVRFVERGTGAAGRLEAISSLTSAQLEIENVEKPTMLHAGDGLEFDGLRSERAEITIGDAAELTLTGVAGDVTTRQGPTSRSLVPSLLEHAARDEWIALLWAALGLAWSLTAWLRTRES